MTTDPRDAYLERWERMDADDKALALVRLNIGVGLVDAWSWADRFRCASMPFWSVAEDYLEWHRDAWVADQMERDHGRHWMPGLRITITGPAR